MRKFVFIFIILALVSTVSLLAQDEKQCHCQYGEVHHPLGVFLHPPLGFRTVFTAAGCAEGQPSPQQQQRQGHHRHHAVTPGATLSVKKRNFH